MLKPFFDWPKFCFDMINDKNPSIKNSIIAGDGAKVIEAIFQWGFAHVIHITRLMKFFLPILHFSSYFFNSIFVFYLSFCSFWFDFLFLSLFCRLSIACYTENKIWGIAKDYYRPSILSSWHIPSKIAFLHPLLPYCALMVIFQVVFELLLMVYCDSFRHYLWTLILV